MSLDRYKNRLIECSLEDSEKVFESVVESYSDDMLECAFFSDAYFGFIVDVFSDERVYSKDGLWLFLMFLGIEKHKLTEDQVDQFVNCLIKHYECYLNKHLSFVVCDFVRMNFSYSYGISVLNKLKKIEDSKPEVLRGFAIHEISNFEAEKNRNKTKGVD